MGMPQGFLFGTKSERGFNSPSGLPMAFGCLSTGQLSSTVMQLFFHDS